MFGAKFSLPKLKPKPKQSLDLVLDKDKKNTKSSAKTSTTETTIPETSTTETTILETSTTKDPESKNTGSNSGRAAILIQEMLRRKTLTIEPILDYSKDTITYPILSEINEDPENFSFLDDLVSDGILAKQLNEKMIICPEHNSTVATSMRIYCPKCDSMDVEKLHLFEHKKCGHIVEDKDSDLVTGENYVCTYCSQKIEDPEKQIKALAMWYECKECSERFDDAKILLHCIRHNHDFDLPDSKLKSTFSYRLKTLHVSKNSDSTQIKSEIVKLLEGYNYVATKNENVKGKSGNLHEIPVFAKGIDGNKILIFGNGGSAADAALPGNLPRQLPTHRTAQDQQWKSACGT